MDRVRVIRVLEYEGPREWIEVCLAARTVKGTKDCGNGCAIREAIVGDFPAVVEDTKLPYVLSVREDTILKRFGWEDSKMEGIMLKRDLTTGKVLAREGDETWDRDLKVAGE